MDLYEDRDFMVCGAVLDLLESQGRISEDPWKDAVVTYPHVEMGGYQYRYYLEVFANNTWG